jgi:MFS family permease
MGWYAMTYSIAGITAPLLGGWLSGINPELIWHLSSLTGVAVFLGFVGLEASLRKSDSIAIQAMEQQMLPK